MIKNKKGFALIDALVSVVLTCLFVIIFLNFKVFATRVIINNENKLEMENRINNKIAEIYIIDNWSEIENEINEDYQILYDYKDVTDYNTESLKINFIYKEKVKEFILERSLIK